GGVAQCTIVSTPVTAASRALPPSRRSTAYGRACRLSTRTSCPSARSRSTTCLPSVPVPPVTRIVVMLIQPFRTPAPPDGAPRIGQDGPDHAGCDIGAGPVEVQLRRVRHRAHPHLVRPGGGQGPSSPPPGRSTGGQQAPWSRHTPHSPVVPGSS